MNIENQSDILPLPGGAAFSIAAGWALDRAASLDDANPGFLAHVCRSRLAWRQALWAALAVDAETDAKVVLRLSGDPQILDAGDGILRAEFARAACATGPRELTKVVFGSCPDGWIGALRKLHGQPMKDPRSYSNLFKLFRSDDPVDRLRSEALRQTSHLDEDMINATLVLAEPALLRPVVVQRLTSVEAAQRAERGVQMIRRFCSWATDRDIGEAAAGGSDRLGRSWIRHVLARADRPCPEEHPCDVDPSLERLVVGRAKQLGQEFKNCLEPARVLPQALSGVWAMVVWRDAELLVETRQADDGVWHLVRIHRAGNKRVRPEHVVAVRNRFRPLGVQCFVPAQSSPDLSEVARAWGGWDAPSLAGLDPWD